MSLLQKVGPDLWQTGGRRWASLKVFKGGPRPYKKRLFDRVLSPVVPTPAGKEHPASRCRAVVMQDRQRPTPIDVAAAQDLRERLLTTPLLLVAHGLQVDKEILHYDLGKLFRQGNLRCLETTRHRNPLLLQQLAVRGTRLEHLEPLLHPQTLFFVSDAVQPALGKALALHSSLPWLQLLGGVVEQKAILSLAELELLQAAGGLDGLRAATSQLLLSAPLALTATLAQPQQLLAAALQAHQNKLESPSSSS